MRISKQIEWDMGHRVTNHDSKCKNLHGHRYRAEICLEGKLVNIKGDSSEGMIMDFGDIKTILMRCIHDILDHGFMFWKKDKLLASFFKRNKALKSIEVLFVPTSENIAAWIFATLDKHFKDKYKTDLKLYSIKLWETPASLAEYNRSDYEKMKGKKK